MMLHALVDLAKREGLVEDADYEPKSVSYVIEIGTGGELRGIVSTMEADPRTRQLVPKRLMVPREQGRTVNVLPQFLWDKAEYVFGLDPDPEGSRQETHLKIRRDSFRELVAEAATSAADPVLQDVVAWLCSEGLTRTQLLERVGATRIEPNAIFAFRHETSPETLVSSLPAARTYWGGRRAASRGPQVQCLVTGELDAPVESHPKLKRVPGGNSAGVSLVSFNSRAFESYGLSRNENAPIGRGAAECVAAALNRLLDRGYPDPRNPARPLPARRIDLVADTAVLYWSRADDSLTDMFSGLLNAEPDLVRAVYAAPALGRQPILEDPSPFYALAISGEMARAKFRCWFETTLGEAVVNIRRHFDDLAIVRPAFMGQEPLPLWRLLRAVAPLQETKRLAPDLASKAFAAILTGNPYPRALLEAAIRRARVEKDRVSPERAALIKAYLLRAHRAQRLPSSFPEVTTTMDSKSQNVPYRLGRLFATLEKLQEEAVEPAATIGERFFGAAAASPVTVLPRLLRGAKHHLAKVNRSVYFQQLIQEILGPLQVVPFPSHLMLEEQGLFALGYYQQRQAFFEKKPTHHEAEEN